MKYTGIVRRLDSLGRIVIPREYRKMHKIKESDPLEIVALESGEILIRKVDLSAELISHAQGMLTAMYEAIHKPIAISDKESFLESKGNKHEVAELKIGGRAVQIIENRKTHRGRGEDFGVEYKHVLVCPVADADTFGAFYIFSDTEISADDERLCTAVAKILGFEMQKY